MAHMFPNEYQSDDNTANMSAFYYLNIYLIFSNNNYANETISIFIRKLCSKKID